MELSVTSICHHDGYNYAYAAIQSLPDYPGPVIYSLTPTYCEGNVLY